MFSHRFKRVFAAVLLTNYLSVPIIDAIVHRVIGERTYTMKVAPSTARTIEQKLLIAHSYACDTIFGGDCVDYSLYTYRQLLLSNPEEANNIRLSSTISPGSGHMWIEYFDGKKWQPFESTVVTPSYTRRLNGKVSMHEYTLLNTTEPAHAHTFPGTEVFLPTHRELLQFDGLAGIAVRQLWHEKETGSQFQFAQKE